MLYDIKTILKELRTLAVSHPSLRRSLESLTSLMDIAANGENHQQRLCAAYLDLRNEVWLLQDALPRKPKNTAARRLSARIELWTSRLRWPLEDRAAHLLGDNAAINMYKGGEHRA